MTFEDLASNVTIHGIKLCLDQETVPAKDGTPGEITDPIWDEYELFSQGQISASGLKPGKLVPDAYIWRGPEGFTLDGLTPAQTATEMGTAHIHARVSLPSPIIGAVPTYDLTSSGIALVSHTMRSTIYYSILGQDACGKPLPMKNGQTQEGSIRSWSFGKQLIIANDASLAGQQGPPGYAAVSHTVGLEPNDKLPLLSSVGIDRTVSILHGPIRWPTRVPTDHDSLRTRTTEHFEEMNGMCECFADREMNKPDLKKEMEDVRLQMEMVRAKD